jgi:hypothetical protein
MNALHDVSAARLDSLKGSAELDETESFGVTHIRSQTLLSLIRELEEFRALNKDCALPAGGSHHDECTRCHRPRKEHGNRRYPACTMFLTDPIEPGARVSHKDDICQRCGQTLRHHRLRQMDHDFVAPVYPPPQPAAAEYMPPLPPPMTPMPNPAFVTNYGGPVLGDRDLKPDNPPDQLEAFTSVLKRTDVEWVVNEIAELGVKIGNRFFFLYKGRSIVYNTAADEAVDGKGPMKWRVVGKREFGEVVKPTQEHLGHPKARDADGNYALPVYDDNGPLENGGWALMPLQPDEPDLITDMPF